MRFNSGQVDMFLPERIRTFGFIFIIVLNPAVFSVPAWAQTGTAGQSAAELRQQLIAMQAQMNKILERLDQLESAKAPPVTPPVSATAELLVPETKPSPRLSPATSTYSTFGEDSIAAPRFDNVPFDPRYNGFFRLPGTPTFLKIGGYFKTDFNYDLKPAGNRDQFVPSSIPIPQSPNVNSETISIRPTRLTLDFLAPSVLGGLRFYLEGDMFGTNATTPRLRHAYAQAKNFLIGQTFTNFMDPDGFPDNLDFEGPVGLVNLRNPQFRYGFAVGSSAAIYLAIEKPTSDVAFSTPEFTLQPNSPAPDFTVRFRDEFKWGHFQAAAILRSVAAYVPAGGRDSVEGYGVNVSLGAKTFGKDNIILAGTVGRGISRYINDTSGLGIDAEVTDNHLKATPAFSFVSAYQHYWTKSLRSSAVFSYADVDNTEHSPGTTYGHSSSTAGNLIWNPFGTLNVGGEFLYGTLNRQDGSKGNAPRFQVSAKYSFVKLDSAK
jgi:DcaP outer membrane protein